jgi:hypothetical protein
LRFFADFRFFAGAFFATFFFATLRFLAAIGLSNLKATTNVDPLARKKVF